MKIPVLVKFYMYFHPDRELHGFRIFEDSIAWEAFLKPFDKHEQHLGFETYMAGDGSYSTIAELRSAYTPKLLANSEAEAIIRFFPDAVNTYGNGTFPTPSDIVGSFDLERVEKAYYAEIAKKENAS